MKKVRYVKVGDTVSADYFGEKVTGMVRKLRVHAGYGEYVFYLDLLAPTTRPDFMGKLRDSVMVRFSQLIEE